MLTVTEPVLIPLLTGGDDSVAAREEIQVGVQVEREGSEVVAQNKEVHKDTVANDVDSIPSDDETLHDVECENLNEQIVRHSS